MRILRERRKQLGLTLAEVARRSGLPIATCQNAERVESQPRIGTAAKLASALDLPVDQLVTSDAA
jgi:transcriptional regulator with XRE-family HTH domain